MAAVLKTVELKGSRGSNPLLSALIWLVGIYKPLFLFRTLNRALISFSTQLHKTIFRKGYES